MGLLSSQDAGNPRYTSARHIRAPKHPVFSLRRADEGVVIGAIWPIVATQEGNVISPGEEGEKVNEKSVDILLHLLHMYKMINSFAVIKDIHKNSKAQLVSLLSTNPLKRLNSAMLECVAHFPTSFSCLWCSSLSPFGPYEDVNL